MSCQDTKTIQSLLGMFIVQISAPGSLLGLLGMKNAIERKRTHD